MDVSFFLKELEKIGRTQQLTGMGGRGLLAGFS